MSLRLMKVAILLAFLGLSIAPAAAELPGKLTLTCSGTATKTDVRSQIGEKPELICMGIIVDFATLRVEFGQVDLATWITHLTETTIQFGGNSDFRLISGNSGRL